jgi:thymidylate synthase (FAD)
MKIEVLDHGYVELIEHWGSDERVIEAARMSTNKGFQGWGTDEAPGDEKLLRYLWEHQHNTPFEMAGLVFEVQAPLFVFREWHRHRTQSFNELSARYTPIPNVNYIPVISRCMIGAGGSNKQAGTIAGAESLTEETATNWRGSLATFYDEAEALYQAALKSGIPKEIARLSIPVGRYSRMRAGANLRNWLAFLSLRMPENAQWEIRQYADAIHTVVAERFPRTAALFDESRAE